MLSTALSACGASQRGSDLSEAPVATLTPVNAECQLGTDDPDSSRSYALYVSMDPMRALTTKVSFWRDGVETVIVENKIQPLLAPPGLGFPARDDPRCRLCR